MSASLRILSILFTTFILPLSAQAEIWRTGYLAGWHQWSMPLEEVDLEALTHVMHFSLLPNADGSLDPQSHGLEGSYVSSVVQQVHAAQRKILVSLGGAETRQRFLGATQSSHRAQFVKNVVDFVMAHDYDGVDVDWEMLPKEDHSRFTLFIKELHQALKTRKPDALLTVACLTEDSDAQLMASLQSYFDQINIMTYVLSGPWPGWVSWHNSALYSGGQTFPGSKEPLPSLESIVDSFVGKGVSASKIGVGLAFFGQVWRGGSGMSKGGVTAPRQSWSSAPQMEYMIYSDLVKNYDLSRNLVYDEAAKAPYLSINRSLASEDEFVSFDNEKSLAEKVVFARQNQLGGIMIWELSAGYLASRPSGARMPLLSAVKQASVMSLPEVSEEEEVPVTPDLEAPEILSLKPSKSTFAKGKTLTLKVKARDNVKVNQIKIFVDGKNLCSKAGAVARCKWVTKKAKKGKHKLEVRVYDDQGNQTAQEKILRLK